MLALRLSARKSETLSHLEDLKISFLVQISFFFRTVFGRFRQYNFEIFLRWQTTVADIFTQFLPTQASYGPAVGKAVGHPE